MGKEIRPDAVAIYIRWSTDEQTEGTTLETQKERCSLYVRSQGWNVNEELIFVDEGYSGGSLDRPAMTKMRQCVKDGRVDCVVSYSLDRLSRSVADTVTLVQHEWMGKCAYRSASQPMSTDDGNPTGQLVFNILASFAEFERALIRDRTHSGIIRRAKEGKYFGSSRPPFGYRRDGKGCLVVDSMSEDGTLQGPAATVKRMFEMATAGPVGQGPFLIARTLAAEGVESPTGRGWWGNVIKKMLQNPVYCGDLVYGREPVNPARKRDKTAPTRLKGQKPHVTVRGAVPAIISRELWEKAQSLYQDRAKSTTRKNLQSNKRSLLTSLARCRCGGPLAVFYDQRKHRFYRCLRYAQSAGSCTQQPGLLDADKMDQIIVKAIKERYGTERLRQLALEEARTERLSGERTSHYTKEMASVDRRLKEIEVEVSKLRKMARSGEIAVGTFEELKADAESEREGLRARRDELGKALEEAQVTDATLSAWETLMAKVDLWDELDVSSQRDVIYGLLRSITMYRRLGTRGAPEIDIVWETP